MNRREALAVIAAGVGVAACGPVGEDGASEAGDGAGAAGGQTPEAAGGETSIWVKDPSPFVQHGTNLETRWRPRRRARNPAQPGRPAGAAQPQADLIHRVRGELAWVLSGGDGPHRVGEPVGHGRDRLRRVGRSAAGRCAGAGRGSGRRRQPLGNLLRTDLVSPRSPGRWAARVNVIREGRLMRTRTDLVSPRSPGRWAARVSDQGGETHEDQDIVHQSENCPIHCASLLGLPGGSRRENPPNGVIGSRQNGPRPVSRRSWKKGRPDSERRPPTYR